VRIFISPPLFYKNSFIFLTKSHYNQEPKENTMYNKTQKAFTMIELIFVIIIIGMLSAIAIPKLSSTVDLAYMTKGKSTLASVRTALATERQKQILRGNTSPITIYNASGRVFTRFTDNNGSRILDNDLPSCTTIGCWSVDTGIYTFYTGGTSNCTYTVTSNRFVDSTSDGCSELEE